MSPPLFGRKFLGGLSTSKVTGPPNPLIIFGTDLAAWYDPSDAATVTQSGGLVSQLNDKSGNGYHLTAAGSARPTYSATGILSNTPGLFFNGTSNIMSAANVNIGTTTFSLFSLSELDEVGGGNLQELFGYTANGDAGDYAAHSSILWHVGNGSSAYTTQVPSNQHPTDTSSIPQAGVSQPHYTGEIRLLGTVLDGSNVQVFLDNQGSTPGAYTPPPFVSPGTFAVGARYGGAQWWKGYVGETVLLKRAPTTLERQKLHSWFIRNWSRVIVCEGDSVTHEGPGPGFGAPSGSVAGAGGFTYISVPNLSPKAFLINIAISGTDFWTNTGSCLVDRTDYTNARLLTKQPGQKYILWFTFANGITGGYHSGTAGPMSDYVAAVGSYCQSQKAAGWDKIVIATALDRTDQEITSARNSFNALITAPGWAAANSVDAIADFASDSIMGVDNSPTVNSSYWKDGVHPNTAGHARLAPIFTDAINSL